MSCLFEMLFGGLAESISEDDRALLRRITDPESPDYLPQRADYCCSLTYSLFIGVQAG